MDSSTWSNLLMVFGLIGVFQGLGMKYSKSVRKKLMIDAEGIDKKYVNFKINFLLFTGTFILLVQLVAHFNPVVGEKMQILLSAFLLLAITSDMIYRKIRRRKQK
ncbi:hypothetical protein JMF89_00240 [Clostridiaceae bacterium UIB06]|uniref:DUF3784 domain-containing protein n=1 Tax=Clostridium thailandense TaxID=2794346 RepID=A0A949U563_9CLOT|nr:hypothetical protein [Clostridium thailandense]MBV7276688.1 hypothetical protein [Clostridium thailandense]MCH5135648.1 hypothetical protein [Clostridiaceae bacterium UIB06]